MNVNIQFKRLHEVDQAVIIELMNHPLVRRHMPMLSHPFGTEAYEAFLASKEQLWSVHGYGPWAFEQDGQFLGWGGLQAENGEPDLALVLHPNHWGSGKHIIKLILSRAFGQMKFQSITALLPPSRTRIRALFRLGFEKDGELWIGNQTFIRFRLNRIQYEANIAGHNR